MNQIICIFLLTGFLSLQVGCTKKPCKNSYTAKDRAFERYYHSDSVKMEEKDEGTDI